MLKQKWMVLVALCVAVSLTAAPANAAEIEGGNSGVMPCMEYIIDSDCQISIDGNTADVYVVVSGISSLATRCDIVVELQERSFLFFWNEVESWSVEEENWWAELSASTAVTSGTTYRAVATVTVWSGTQSETQTLTSDTIKAP